MLSKTRSTPVYSAAPGVIPDTITGPVTNGATVAGEQPAAVAQPVAQNGTAHAAATAVAENGTARSAARALPQPAAMKFVVFEDNAGGYHWAILARSGETLVQSASLASYEEAKQAARVVHAGATSAAFEVRAPSAAPIAISDRRNAATARDALDAERWLDEGGSFSIEAARK
jgi:uncharacterized protein YegP (UPF0339 family)